MVFKPGQIDTNSSNVVTNDTDIGSNATLASNAESDAVVASNVASTADSKADVASNAASTADSKADVASNAASGAASDVDVVEADDRYAKSVYSDPATDSYAITQIDVTSGSDAIYISHSSSAVA